MKQHVSRSIRISVVVIALLAAFTPVRGGQAWSLAGEWQFALDLPGAGVANHWFKKTLPDTIRLPSTTDERRKGTPNTNTNFVKHLSRAFPYHGAAWYQREIIIPDAWKGGHTSLFLERTKHSTVWLDDTLLGEQDSLATPHEYTLNAAPGEHRLTICINNKLHPPVNGGHQLSEDTQTDWNGIVGRIELRHTDAVWLKNVRVNYLRQERAIEVSGEIEKLPGTVLKGRSSLRVTAQPWRGTGKYSGTQVCDLNGASPTQFTQRLKLDANAALWDEFAPELYDLSVKLEAGAFLDEVRLSFGLRDFARQGTQFTINGRPTFLRGKHDACVYPQTGYAPMETESWVSIFKIAKEYGINHYRFHSWCPPEAAFAAADEVGIYLQPELPNFGGDLSKKPEAAEFTKTEGLRILKAYGNHPSFVMFALGNEMGGGRDVRAGIIRDFRQADNRRLYAQASNYELSDPQFAEGDDYWTTMRTRKGAEGAVRGSFAHCDAPLGFVQAGPPGTTYDFSAAIAGVPVPVIGHEVGQYEVFPNFHEITKYPRLHGVLRAWNLDVFRERLRAKKMLDQADDFFRASGALSVLCYRADIEAALRTRGFGGFQLLDLQDFPGQGTALVGILDSFMDSKGFIEPKAWREFCGPTVPLAIMERFTWSGGETFTAGLKVAHYGPKTLTKANVQWRLLEENGQVMGMGETPLAELAPGTFADLGSVRAGLPTFALPHKLTLELRLAGTDFRNSYPLWVYPPNNTAKPLDSVTVCRSLDEQTLNALTKGQRVLLLPELKSITANSIEGFFASDFWCYPMFRGISERAKKPVAPGTLGILCNPKHPAFTLFPTAFHTDWQWFHLLMNSRPLILDDTPANFRPLVQVIDNFERNHKLGVLFEARVGAGKLLVCTSDLPGMSDRPEARQLLSSLVFYAGSEQFNPAPELSLATLKKLLNF
ncbi:MAG: sugar-binding domain-containing protein [Verrucomicrobiota bacterium]